MQIFQLLQDPLRGHTKRNPSVSASSPPPTQRIPKLPTPTSTPGHKQRHSHARQPLTSFYLHAASTKRTRNPAPTRLSGERSRSAGKTKIHRKLHNQVTLSNRRTTAIKAAAELRKPSRRHGRWRKETEAERNPKGPSERARQRSGGEMNTIRIPRSNWLN